jgi:predicted amidohydrolase
MQSTQVKIALVQNSCSSDVRANIDAALRGVRAAAAKGANIVCLQELFSSVYFCQIEDHKYFELAEPIPGPTTEAMQAVAKECGVVLIASLFERRAPGLYHNTAAIIDADGSFLGKYRKMHIPDDPLHGADRANEKRPGPPPVCRDNVVRQIVQREYRPHRLRLSIGAAAAASVSVQKPLQRLDQAVLLISGKINRLSFSESEFSKKLN